MNAIFVTLIASNENDFFDSFGVSFFIRCAQDKEKVPAVKGVIYGQVLEEKSATGVNDSNNKLINNAFTGQIREKVAKVCKAEGYWIRLQKADGTTMLVRAKDHAF